MFIPARAAILENRPRLSADSSLGSIFIVAVYHGIDKNAYNKIVNEIGKTIIGQRDIIEHLLISLLSQGHCLLIGVPGLAKTLLIKTLADVLDLSFSRIQFTPDLMPSDITEWTQTELYNVMAWSTA